MHMKISAFAIAVLQFFCALVIWPWFFVPAPVPLALSEYTQPPALTVSGDYYVSPDGSDDGDGSYQNPFATIEKARDVVRALDKTNCNGITVCLMAGEYSVDGLVFSEEDSGTESCPVKYCAYGDGEVVINSGFRLEADDFLPVDGAMAKRLKSGVRNKVLKVDLAECGLSVSDLGEIHSIGSFNTASLYGEAGPMYSELFFNDKRMTLARYPDKGGFVRTGEIIYNSLGESNAPQGWWGYQSPAGDIFETDKKTTSRTASWATLDDVWVMGYWWFDWADGSSPVKSVRGNLLETAYASCYGIREDVPYYFFNVFEELDSPSEYYIDRNEGILYFYPDDDIGKGGINITVSLDNVITSRADYVTFENLTLQGTRGDGIRIDADNVTVRRCTVKNIGGTAVIANGYNNLIAECEIYHTGRGGIYIDGGDSETLTAGNSRADNNYIHDWSEVYLTYQAGVKLLGTGNVCSHNEMCNSPHQAITYSGNNLLIEYNEIHDVVLQSGDAGAIYAGGTWILYGNVIRYNCIYRLGSGDYRPFGIYMDDGLSGQTIYGNLLLDVPGNGIMLGGGRDLIVKNNVIIGSWRGINYDARVIEGVLDENFWFGGAREGGGFWTTLYSSPWQTDIWKAAYPQMSRISGDFSDKQNPYFGPNPAFSEVSDNIIMAKSPVPNIGSINTFVSDFSTVEHNAVVNYGTVYSVMPGFKKGDYTVNTVSLFAGELTDGFYQLPLSEMGRY